MVAQAAAIEVDGEQPRRAGFSQSGSGQPSGPMVHRQQRRDRQDERRSTSTARTWCRVAFSWSSRTVFPPSRDVVQRPKPKTDFLKGNATGRTGFHPTASLTGNGDSSFYTYVGTITGFTSTMTAAQRPPIAGGLEARDVRRRDVRQLGRRGGQMRTACTGATDAAPAGGIMNEGPRYHVTHLNISYASGFLAAWACGAGSGAPWNTGGCLDAVHRMMGYRFQFDDITHPTSVNRGGVATST